MVIGTLALDPGDLLAWLIVGLDLLPNKKS